jgi:AraC-like DNA-binding protein
MASVGNALVTAILDAIALPRDEQQALLERVELDEIAIRDVTARTSVAHFVRLWVELVRTTGDDFLGLRVGGAIPPHRFGLVSQQDRELRELLARFGEYARLVNDGLVCTLAQDGEHARLCFGWDVPELQRHAVDIAFVAIVRWARARLGDAFVLHEVRCTHALEVVRPRYEQIFGAPCCFGRASNELVFDASALSRPIPPADLELGAVLDRGARPVPADLLVRVREILDRELRAGRVAELPRICAELRIAPRQLQRGLQDRGTGVRALLDEIRRAMAPTLLLAPDANVEQVGFRLGYAEPTAFIRAFKKWYGTTPGDYRRDPPRS